MTNKFKILNYNYKLKTFVLVIEIYNLVFAFYL